jgi:hypothetical protein
MITPYANISAEDHSGRVRTLLSRRGHTARRNLAMSIELEQFESGAT